MSFPARRRGEKRLPGEIAPASPPADPGQSTLRVVARPAQEQVARDVVLKLAQSGRDGTNSKQLARLTGRSLRTVQYHLRRLKEQGEAEEPYRGHWVAKRVLDDLTSDPYSRLGLQNLRLRITGLREAPPPPCFVARAWEDQDGGDAGPFRLCHLAWRARTVSVRRYQSGTVEVIVEAHVPFPLEQVTGLYEFLVAQLGLEQGETATVTYYEVNSDHGVFRADPEVPYYELRDFTSNVAHVIYQKRGALREEWRSWQPKDDDGRPLTPRVMVEQLTEGSWIARHERLTVKEFEVNAQRIEVLRLEAAAREAARAVQSGVAPVLREPKGVSPSDALTEGFA